MPKRKQELAPAEQSERFRAAVRELEAAGELSPTEADERFERAVQRVIPKKGSPLRGRRDDA